MDRSSNRPLRTVVGTYGCSRLDRVVRVRPPRGHLFNKPHREGVYNVPCPCGERHRLRPEWRWATPREREEAELTLCSRDRVA